MLMHMYINNFKTTLDFNIYYENVKNIFTYCNNNIIQFS